MEFWGAEVKSGEPLKVVPGDGMVLHLSQANLGEQKKEKANESVCLFVNVDGKKLVLGTLFSDKLPQQQFDLVFDRDFELSHNWKSGSIYFYGYKASNPIDDEELPGQFSDDESEEEEDIPLTTAPNGMVAGSAKPGAAVKTEKAKESNAGKQKVKIVEPSKEESSDEDNMSEDDDSEGDDDDSDDDSDESDEETPQKVAPSKKRPADSATKTPVTDKKAKVTPQKTDGKKGAPHVATPYPTKQAGKTPAPSADKKENPKTPKSAGSVKCTSCPKTFGSEKALESHSKAKHGEGK